VKKSKIVLLSTYDSPELPYFVERLQRSGISISSIIYAGKISDKDRQIVERRIEKTFLNKDILNLDISQIPFYFVNNHNSKESLSILKRLKPDILVNAGTPNIIKKRLLDLPRLGILNSHPGLLPEYRGCTCPEWAIYNDDPIGATCHFMTEDIDRGAILYKERMAIKKDWTYRKIRTKIVFHSIKIMSRGIKKAMCLNKNYRRLPSSKEGKYYHVIDERKMREVLSRLKKGGYKWSA